MQNQHLEPICSENGLNVLRSLATDEWFESLVAGSRDAVLVADASGRCLVANAPAEHLLGFNQSEFLHLQMSDIVVQWPGRFCNPDAGVALNDRWRGELQVRHKNGELLLVKAWLVNLEDSLGCAVAFFLRGGADQVERAVGGGVRFKDSDDASFDLNRDETMIAERTRAEAELKAVMATAVDAKRSLRESEARFRGAFDASSIGMALVSREGRFLQVNPALCGIVGYTAEELLARTFQDITHPDDVDTDRDLLRQLLANEINTYQIEKNYICKSADSITGRLTVSIVRDAGGEPPYFVAQLQDITPFKASGAALREAEARYRSLVEQIPAAVYLDAAEGLGQPLYVSPRIEAMLGYTPEEWIGSPHLWAERVHPDDRSRIMNEVAEANARGTSLNLEYRFLARDGRIVWVNDEVSLIFDDEGNRRCWQGMMVDITDRKLAEEELRAAKEAAEEASRLKSAFLSMATHELRTPLTIISGYVELLAASANAHLTRDEQEYLEIAQTGAKTLGALIDDLLDLARIEAGRLDVVIRPVDVAEALERVRRMVAGQTTEKGLTLQVNTTANLPHIAADSNRLAQVLLNLFGNAIKFTERGGIRGSVRESHGGVLITVSDTGIGIAPDALPHIFDEFRQVESGTTRRFGGTGLGLAIARRLIEMQNGTIRVESTVGVGSTFTVWLPVADSALLAPESDAMETSARSSR